MRAASLCVSDQYIIAFNHFAPGAVKYQVSAPIPSLELPKSHINTKVVSWEVGHK